MLPLNVIQLARGCPFGLVNLRDLMHVGVDRHTAAAWVAAGALERLAPGLHRIPGAPVPLTQCLGVAQRYLAGFDRGAPGPAMISGAGALALYGIEGFTLPCHPLALVDRSRRVRVRNAPFAVRRVELRRIHRQQIGHVQVADAARALADAALDGALGDRALRVGVDAVRGRPRAITDMVRVWRETGHVGARRLLAMTAAGDFEQESEGERDAFRRLFLPRPPVPDCQVRVLGRFRADFVFLAAGLIIEYYGEVHRDQWKRDAMRVLALQQAGYEVVIITAPALRDAAAVAAHIHRLRRQREQLVREGRLRLPPLPVQPPRLTPLRTLEPAG